MKEIKETLSENERKRLTSTIKNNCSDKNKVEYITKVEDFISGGEYIIICFTDRDNAHFPPFPLTFSKGKVFKGMEINKRYSLKELQIEL